MAHGSGEHERRIRPRSLLGADESTVRGANYRATKPDHLGYQPSQATRSIPPGRGAGLARGSVRSESLAAPKTHLRPRALFVCASVAGSGRMCAAGGLEWAALHQAFLRLHNFSPFTKIVEKLFSPSNRGESECQSFSASRWLHNAGTVCRGWQTAAFRSPLETPRVQQPSGRCCAGKQVAR